MDIKLLVTDLDDTLISETSGVTTRAIDAIAKVKEKGIKATIATGRMHTSAFPFARTLDIVEPIISYNGALVKHVYSNNQIIHWPVDYDYAIEVLQFAKDMGKFIQYYSTENYYVPSHCDDSVEYGRRTTTKAIETNEGLIKSLDFDPTKLLMIGSSKQDSEKLYNLAVKIFAGRLNITRSSDTYIEFNNIKASKGAACEVLAKYYGFELENVISIGNGGNDVDMIKKCGFGIAVENAVPQAKEAADYICPSQEEDGAVQAIERFLLNR